MSWSMPPAVAMTTSPSALAAAEASALAAGARAPTAMAAAMMIASAVTARQVVPWAFMTAFSLMLFQTNPRRPLRSPSQAAPPSPPFLAEAPSAELLRRPHQHQGEDRQQGGDDGQHRRDEELEILEHLPRQCHVGEVGEEERHRSVVERGEE